MKTLSCSEYKGYTPDTRKGNYSINYTASDRVLTAEDPGYDIEAEKTDTTPVESTYDGNDQGNSIHNHNPISSL